jgi:hypothetical protein
MVQMRTAVTAPPHWGVEDTPDGRRVLRIPSASSGAPSDWGGPDVSLVLYPLQALPDPSSAAIEPFLRRDLPAGAKLKIVTNQKGRTTLGAPLVLLEAQVVDASGKVVEERLAAVYEFLEYGGGAMARSQSHERLAAHKAEILSVLSTARADFTGQIAALEQLFVGFPEDVSWGS